MSQLFTSGGQSTGVSALTEALKHCNPKEGISVILEHAGDIAAALKKDPRRYYDLALKYAPFDEEFEPAAVQKKLKQLK